MAGEVVGETEQLRGFAVVGILGQSRPQGLDGPQEVTLLVVGRAQFSRQASRDRLTCGKVLQLSDCLVVMTVAEQELGCREGGWF